MKIFGARYEKGELHLKCEPPDGLKFVYGFKGEGEYEILPQKQKRKRRSNDANAYAWALINEIAGKLGIPPNDVYRNQIRDSGPVMEEPETVPLENLDEYISRWKGDHLGRQVALAQSYTFGCVEVYRIKGSSDYDTKQMATFIDGLIQEAEALEIETKDPAWVQSLLDSWEARK